MAAICLSLNVLNNKCDDKVTIIKVVIRIMERQSDIHSGITDVIQFLISLIYIKDIRNYLINYLLIWKF